MPQIITCPDCDRKLRLPDNLLGKKVRCPGCQVMFLAAATDESPAEEPDEEPAPRRRPASRAEGYVDKARSSPRHADREEEEERPRRRREEEERPRRRDEEDEEDYEERGPSPRDQKVGWNKVRLGINLVVIGMWVWLGGTVLAALGGLLGLVLLGGAIRSSSSQAGLASLGFAGILILLAAGIYYLCVFVELVLRLIGYGLCMAVPPRRESALKPLAVTAFSLGIAYTVFSLLNIVVSGFTGFASSLTNRSGMNAAGTGLSLVGGLCAMASFIVYIFFLRSVCHNTRAREHASKPIAVLIALVVFWAVTILIGVLMACAGGVAIAKAVQSQSADSAVRSMGAWVIIFIVVACLLGLVYLGLQVWYLMVLQNIRDAVASYRRRL